MRSRKRGKGCESGICLGERINRGGSGKRNPDYHRKLPSVCCVPPQCAQRGHGAALQAAVESEQSQLCQERSAGCCPAEVINAGGRKRTGAASPTGEKWMSRRKSCSSVFLLCEFGDWLRLMPAATGASCRACPGSC